MSSVAPLSCIVSIGGDLSIASNSLSSLEGLQGLQSIGGDLSITGAVLSSLAGLSSLRALGGDLALSTIPALADEPILPSLTALRELRAEALPSCPRLSALEQADAISIVDCGAAADTLFPSLLTVEAELHVEPSPEVSWLSLSPALAAVGSLSITTDGMLDLDGLDTLSTVDDALTLGPSTGLTALPSFPALSSVGGELSIEWNTELTDISGLSALRSVGGGVALTHNRYLTGLSGLESLMEVGGLEISDLVRLSDLDALSALEVVYGSLHIDRNSRLSRVDGLSQLGRIDGDLSIQDNPWLSTTDAEGLLTEIGSANIGGTVTISGNAAP